MLSVKLRKQVRVRNGILTVEDLDKKIDAGTKPIADGIGGKLL